MKRTEKHRKAAQSNRYFVRVSFDEKSGLCYIDNNMVDHLYVQISCFLLMLPSN